MIHLVGDLIIDEYWHGETTRISPEAPVPIVSLKEKKCQLGGAGNVYMNIRGVDPFDLNFITYADEKALELLPMFEPNPPTVFQTSKIPLKIRILSEGHYMSRVDDEDWIESTELENQVWKETKLDKKDIVILSDYNKGTIKDPSSFISKTKAKVIVDPKLSLDNYKGAYVCTPNKKEFESYVGSWNNAKELITKATLTRDHLQLTYLIVTLGAEGVLLIGDSIEHYEATQQEVYDVTGAGDTFVAGLALSLSKGLNISQSTIIANKLAGISVGHNGTYVINEQDWEKCSESINNWT